MKSIPSTWPHYWTQRLRKLLIVAVYIALCLTLSGCAYITYPLARFASLVVEQPDLGGGPRVKMDPENPEAIVVTGTLIHSSWGIKDMKLLRKKDFLLMKMHMAHGGFGRTNLYDHFVFTIDIPHDVNAVKFGNKRTTIWSRTPSQSPSR